MKIKRKGKNIVIQTESNEQASKMFKLMKKEIARKLEKRKEDFIHTILCA